MKVKATSPGYFGSKVRVVGEVFSIDNQQQFSKNWMEPVGWKVDGRKTRGKPQVKPASSEAV